MRYPNMTFEYDMSFVAGLISEISRILEKFELGALSPKENNSARGQSSCS